MVISVISLFRWGSQNSANAAAAQTRVLAGRMDGAAFPFRELKLGPQSAPAREQTPGAWTTPAGSPKSLRPLISVIVLNYNGAPWLKRCLDSIRGQTLSDQIEVIVADNASADQSYQLAKELMRDWPRGLAVQLGTNLGYTEGNNRAAGQAHGQYLFFLNNDSWLEPDCLENLMRETRAAEAAVAGPLVMNYSDGFPQQDASREGFDVFGFLCTPALGPGLHEIFVAGGCALLVDADWFRELGGFDRQFFMYADEHDLCWRAWVAGARVILAPSAKAYHRSAASVNPHGHDRIVEIRTSDTKRFYANRNGLLVLLKNAEHVLLVIVPLQLLLLAAETLGVAMLTRRWSHFRRAFIEAVSDCWRLRRHIMAERRRVRKLRHHGDFWMLRFLRLRLNRWEEFRRVCRFGSLKVDPK
jgi:GT2 family glycosyltransferase